MFKDYERIFEDFVYEYTSSTSIEKEKIKEDCICRKEDDWDWYKLCIYKVNNEYFLQYPIEVYGEPLDVKIPIQYCPRCGRKLKGDV